METFCESKFLLGCLEHHEALTDCPISGQGSSYFRILCPKLEMHKLKVRIHRVGLLQTTFPCWNSKWICVANSVWKKNCLDKRKIALLFPGCTRWNEYGISFWSFRFFIGFKHLRFEGKKVMRPMSTKFSLTFFFNWGKLAQFAFHTRHPCWPEKLVPPTEVFFRIHCLSFLIHQDASFFQLEWQPSEWQLFKSSVQHSEHCPMSTWASFSSLQPTGPILARTYTKMVFVGLGITKFLCTKTSQHAKPKNQILVTPATNMWFIPNPFLFGKRFATLPPPDCMSQTHPKIRFGKRSHVFQRWERIEQRQRAGIEKKARQ